MSIVDRLSPYICPATRAPLEFSDGRCTTSDGRAYPVDDGIPNFLAFPPQESDEGQASLDQLVRTAEQQDWRAALAATFGGDSHMCRYVTDRGRTQFIDLLGIRSDECVLEIGSGLGQMTTELAPRAADVYALEVVPGQARFTRERCRQEGHVNVQIACGGDDCRLPYADGMFDVVVMNLVFEWCASRLADESRVSGQQRLLAECHRVLKPGGRMYLSTKNRYALRFLLGRSGDEHVWGWRFGSALPRPVLWLLLALLKRPIPPGLLHSYPALRRMLEQSGFAVRGSYWTVPEMRFPDHIVSNDTRSIRAIRRDQRPVQGEQRITRMLMPLIPAALVKYVTPNLTFIVVKA